jgi:hypothetical protein
VFTTEKLFPILDRFEADIANEAAMDRRRWGGGAYMDLHSGIAHVKQYITERREYVKIEINALRQNPQTSVEQQQRIR